MSITGTLRAAQISGDIGNAGSGLKGDSFYDPAHSYSKPIPLSSSDPILGLLPEFNPHMPTLSDQYEEPSLKKEDSWDAPETVRVTRSNPTKKASKPSGARKQPKQETKTRRKREPAKQNPHERSLERNRIAASKSRKRKKQWTESLEEKKQRLERLHGELQASYVDLLQELSQLKNFLIGHAACHEPNIDIWIHHEASKYVDKLNGQFMQRQGGMPFSQSTEGEYFLRVPCPG
jgi:hypothetical protein